MGPDVDVRATQPWGSRDAGDEALLGYEVSKVLDERRIFMFGLDAFPAAQNM